MEGEVEQNKPVYTPCPRISCHKRSVCCDCMRKHLASQQMPNCWKDFPPATNVMVCVGGRLTAVDISVLHREDENSQNICPLTLKQSHGM